MWVPIWIKLVKLVNSVKKLIMLKLNKNYSKDSIAMVVLALIGALVLVEVLIWRVFIMVITVIITVIIMVIRILVK